MIETALIVIALVVAGLFALWLVVSLVILAFMGAIVILSYAAEQRFLGIVFYAAAWVFLFPIMLTASVVVGFIVYRTDRKAERERAYGQRRSDRQSRRAISDMKPPDDPRERHKWANRLPPYDT